MPLPATIRSVLSQDSVVLPLARAPLDDEPDSKEEIAAVQILKQGAEVSSNDSGPQTA